MKAAHIGSFIGPRLSQSKTRIVSAHLQKATGRLPSEEEVRAAFASYIRYWFDAFRVTGIDPQTAKSIIASDGLEYIEEARKLGRGVILALPHMGNWDIAGAWLVGNGVPLTVVVEALEPPEMFEWFAKYRSSLGFSVVVNGPKVGSALLGALKRNEAIALLCDRDVDGTGGAYEFFGETTAIPKGPATLALRSGAPLLPVAVVEEGDSYRALIQPAIPAEREGRLGDDVDRMTSALIKEFERLIRLAPEQWHVFQPNWPSER